LDRNGKFFITDVKVETHTVDDDEYPPIRTIYLTYMPPESHVVMPEDRWANYEDQEEEGEEDYTDEPNEGEEEYYTDEPDEEEGDY
jgi:hypothetical protein